MKTKNWIILFLFLVIILVSSIYISRFVANALQNLLAESSIDQQKIKLTDRTYINLYMQCVVILFSLICLPFIFSSSYLQSKINKYNWWKPMLAVELTGLVLAYFTTPSDMISTILIFILWQLPVAVNLIVLSMVIRRNNRKE